MTIGEKNHILIMMMPELMRLVLKYPKVERSKNISHAKRTTGMTGISHSKHSDNIPTNLPGHFLEVLNCCKLKQHAFFFSRIKFYVFCHN